MAVKNQIWIDDCWGCVHHSFNPDHMRGPFCGDNIPPLEIPTEDDGETWPIPDWCPILEEQREEK